MTFSIVARAAAGSGRTAYGVAVASKFLSVGAAVPAADATHGALATQAAANLAYRPQGLALLATGTPAAGVVAGLTAADLHAAERQLGVVGPTGDGASFTGPGCLTWAGGRTGPGYAIQGNILAGPQVVEEMELAWLAAVPAVPTGTAVPTSGATADGETGGAPGALGIALARRLIVALAAGDAAGGDRRGRQSAAVLVAEVGGGYGGGSDVAVDLRVDDHAEPIPELGRLLELHELYFGRPDPATLVELAGPVADEVRGLLAALGHADPDLDAALAGWAGVENYEERLVPGRIDPLVLGRLRTAGTAQEA
jgi:uncharacterized Ntn-hydrolase superfamily protein